MTRIVGWLFSTLGCLSLDLHSDGAKIAWKRMGMRDENNDEIVG